MRAVSIDAFGTTPALTEAPTPVPGPGEVLVKVRASSVNGFDGAVIYGVFKDMMEHKFPIVLGKDFAGTVEAVGEGVARNVGDRVFGVLMKPVISDGTFAQYLVAADGYGIAEIPDGVDFPQAGALGVAGTAALLVIDALAPKQGETILIVGATGGVGAYAVQLAAAAGATVIATAKPGQEAEFVRGLGATHVVDHTGDLAAQVRALAPQGVTTAVHLAGDGEPVAGLLASGGRIASTLGFVPEQAAAGDITAHSIMVNPETATLDRLATAVAAGELRVPINATFDLDAVPQAFGAFAAGTLGKIAVSIA